MRDVLSIRRSTYYRSHWLSSQSGPEVMPPAAENILYFIYDVSTYVGKAYRVIDVIVYSPKCIL